MPKRLLTRYALMLALPLLSFMFATPTFACFPPYIMPLEERLDKAPIVFVGTVVEVIPLGGSYVIARVEVETYLQGTGTTVVEIFPLTDYVDADCIYYPPLLGQRAMFFAHEYDNIGLRNYAQKNGITYSGNALLLALSQPNSVIYAVFDDTIAQAQAYLNDPLRPFYRVQWQMQSWDAGSVSITVALWGLGILGVLVVGLVIKWRLAAYYHSKAKHSDMAT